MIDNDKLKTWIRNVNASADQVRRMKADPLQGLSDEEAERAVDGLVKDLMDIAELEERHD